MAELHGSQMCYIFPDFILHEGRAHFKLKLFHPILHDIQFIQHYCCCCMYIQFAVKIPERFASVVDPDRHYR